MAADQLVQARIDGAVKEEAAAVLHASGWVGSFGYTYARTDNLTRFVNRNDAIFGAPWATGLGADGSNGIGDLTAVASTAKSRYHGLSFSLRQMVQDALQFQLNYTLS